MTFAELLAETAACLNQAGISASALEARLILEHCSGLAHTEILLRSRCSVEPALLACCRDLRRKRSGRIPLPYLTGHKEFWSLDFHVSPAVLVPRPETEFLLEHICSVYKNNIPPKHILDLCTGSGVIAIVLALEMACPVVATDISASALEVAAINCQRHGVEDLVDLRLGDLFAVFAEHGKLSEKGIIAVDKQPNFCADFPRQRKKKFDLIVSNPPYIADAEIDSLEPEVAIAEPRLALSGGPSGCEILARIAREAPLFLQPGGWIFLEIGADQGPEALSLFSSPEYEDVAVVPDWSGRTRVVQARSARI